MRTSNMVENVYNTFVNTSMTMPHMSMIPDILLGYHISNFTTTLAPTYILFCPFNKSFIYFYTPIIICCAMLHFTFLIFFLIKNSELLVVLVLTFLCP